MSEEAATILYGENTADKFKKNLDLSHIIPNSTIEVHIDPNLSIYNSFPVFVNWSIGEENIGFVKFECHQDYVHFVTLEIVPAYQNHGIFKELINKWLELGKEFKIKWLQLIPANKNVQTIFELGGFEYQEINSQTIFATRVNGRIKEYCEWINGAPEPVWHKKILEQIGKDNG